jgi:HPt (histidine-containing phosphotransfer) domain-containing protein
MSSRNGSAKNDGIGQTRDELFSYEDALELMGGARDLVIELGAVLLEHLDESIAAVSRTVAAGDPRALEESAHRLKGSVAALACRRVAATAQSLEDLGGAGGLEDAAVVLDRLRSEVTALKEELRVFLEEAVERHPAV